MNYEFFGPSTTTLITGFLVSFSSMALKGFQHKNVVGNHYGLVLTTSYMMTAADFAMFGLILKDGWGMYLPIGTGGALGMIFGMTAHNRIVTAIANWKRKKADNA